jgi:hypothetical protein
MEEEDKSSAETTYLLDDFQPKQQHANRSSLKKCPSVRSRVSATYINLQWAVVTVSIAYLDVQYRGMSPTEFISRAVFFSE